MLNIYVYGAGDENPAPVIVKCMCVILASGKCTIVPTLEHSDLAVAPLLSHFLSLNDIYTPKIGTLVFHPSLLPRHRGADAIKWAFKNQETYTGATWFWPDEGIDTGDICEQEVLAIPLDVTPREFYDEKVVPAAVRMLVRILKDVENGNIRRIPQQSTESSYELPLSREPR